MPTRPFRVVLDTNVMVRGVGNSRSPSGQVLALCDQRVVIPLISRPVLAEYRTVLNDPAIGSRYSDLSTTKVETELARLAYLGDLIRKNNVRFAFPRDPKDSKFIELAIAGGAGAIVTGDRDMLDLPKGRDEVSKRFRQRLPGIHVMRPEVFLDWIALSRLHLN